MYRLSGAEAIVIAAHMKGNGYYSIKVCDIMQQRDIWLHGYTA